MNKKVIEQEIKEIADAWKDKEGNLIMILHQIQNRYGYIPREVSLVVSEVLDVPLARIYEVITFYHFFRLQPRGKFAINICMGTACYVNGADKVAAKIKEELGIDFGQTTTDGLFSLNSALCLGTCGLAPVVMINDQVFPKVTPDKVPALLEKIVEQGGS